MTAAHRAHLTLERVTLFMHWAWYLSLAFYYNTPLMALLYIFVSQAGCGIMLAVVFSVNHNGMPVFDSDRAQNMDFYELQILTGRDVEPSIFNDFFTGGLK